MLDARPYQRLKLIEPTVKRGHVELREEKIKVSRHGEVPNMSLLITQGALETLKVVLWWPGNGLHAT